ncbi:MAG: DUF3830 family protein [Armatimonadetes bacterium]|nr:DUF3830 family protein [Armatimonadota bacterium]
MPRHVALEADGVKALAIMHDGASPKVCQALWDRLPLALTFHHSNFCGGQVFAGLTGPNYVDIEREAGQLFIQPGDLVYAFRPPHLGRGAPAAFSEIALYYGRDARRWTTRGYGIVRDRAYGSTIWATVVEGLDRIAERLEDIRARGGKVVTITRVE